MQDYGTRQTDLAVKRAEWRLSRVYHQAARDIEDKLKTWEKGHAAREAQYRQQVKDGKITQADFDAWMRGQVFQEKQWLARRDEIDAILLNADKVAAKIVNEGKLGVFASNANYIGYDLEHSAGINTGFTLYDGPTVARLVKSDPQILPKAREGVKKDKAYTYYNKLMNSAITQGIIQGETIPQIAKRIAQTTGERSYTSAVRNARTAYTGAQNAGRMEGLHQAQALGIKVQKKWMATLDNRTRDAHADLDGQVRDVDEPFDSELGPIDYPGDPNADPGNGYNCRCTLVYVYPEYPSEMQRRDNETGEIVGDMTYREWEAMKQGKSLISNPGQKPTFMSSENAIEDILNEHGDEWIDQYYDGGPDDIGDPIGKALSDRIGYSEPPTIVDEISPDMTIVYRGVHDQGSRKASDFIEDFKRGDCFVGQGIMGCGTYTANDRDVVKTYGDDILTIGIPRTAKIINLSDLKAMAKADSTCPEWIKADMGRYGMYKGYDVITKHVPSFDCDYYLVLNRGIVEVRR